MYTAIRCSRAAVFDNRALRLTPAQVKARTGCTHLINGWLFDNDPDSKTYLQPCNWLVIDGKVLSSDLYNDWGFACGPEGAPVMSTDRSRTYISGVPLLKWGQRLERKLTPDVARPSSRTAVGWRADGSVVLWCSREILTREQLQDKLLELGCEDALMLDGGGSTQGEFPGQVMRSSRIVSNMILLWEETEEKPVSEKQRCVCLDAGHDAGNLANASPDGTYYEHEFCLDMAKRIRAYLERHGVTVTETRPDGKAVSLAERCRIANSAGAELFVSLHSNAAAGTGWSSARGWECYVYGLSGERYKAARAILARVEGVCPAIRTEPIKARSDLYVLKHTTAPAVLIEHGFHSNKEDVERLKDSAYREKLAEAEARGIIDWMGIPWLEVSELEDAVDKLAAAGIIDSPDYWKAGDYSANTVRMLIIKMAAALD